MCAKVNRLQFSTHLQRFCIEIDVTLPDSGVVALFGPSGSGKSSILEVIAGFRRARGTIQIGDDYWLNTGTGTLVPPHKRPVGYLFQDAQLFGHLSVRENLLFPLRYLGRRPQTMNLDEVIHAFDLHELLNRRPSSLSGGEARRCALARTLLRQPELLLLDEPMSGIDTARKAEILPYVDKLVEHFKIPTILVSHALDEVATISEQMLILRDGRIESQGPTNTILGDLITLDLTPDAERSVVVSMIVRDSEPEQQLCHVHSDDLTLVVPTRQPLAIGKPVRVRVRAVDVALATVRPQNLSIRNIVPGRVLDVEEHLEVPHCDVRVQLGSTLIFARITRASARDLELIPGCSVFALIKAVALDA